MIQRSDLELRSFRFTELPAQSTSFRVTDSEMQPYLEYGSKLARKIAAEKILLAEQEGISSTAMSEKIEERCQIAVDTLKKTISGKLPATRRFLYKFTVGLKMPLEKANEFFALCGGALCEDCAADYICQCALRDGDPIEVFLDEMKCYTNLELHLRERVDAK